jgi:hypothetical protein
MYSYYKLFALGKYRCLAYTVENTNSLHYAFFSISLKSDVYLLRVPPPFKMYSKSADYGHLRVDLYLRFLNSANLTYVDDYARGTA